MWFALAHSLAHCADGRKGDLLKKLAPALTRDAKASAYLERKKTYYRCVAIAMLVCAISCLYSLLW